MRRRFSYILFWLALAGLPGCVIVDVGVTNPIPGLSKVAIAPFFNLSNERSVDGRRVTAAYFSELSKVPGFQVLPPGIAENAIVENRLEMSDPQDVLELARILKVDAVVVGAVTDYDPWHPRMGWQVSWYSPYPWKFEPGVPTDIHTRRRFNHEDLDGNGDQLEHPGEEHGWERVKRLGRHLNRGRLRAVEVVRGQSDDKTDNDSPAEVLSPTPQPPITSSELATMPTEATGTADKALEVSSSRTDWMDRMLWPARWSVGAIKGGYSKIWNRSADGADSARERTRSGFKAGRDRTLDKIDEAHSRTNAGVRAVRERTLDGIDEVHLRANAGVRAARDRTVEGVESAHYRVRGGIHAAGARTVEGLEEAHSRARGGLQAGRDRAWLGYSNAKELGQDGLDAAKRRLEDVRNWVTATDEQQPFPFMPPPEPPLRELPPGPMLVIIPDGMPTPGPGSSIPFQSSVRPARTGSNVPFKLQPAELDQRCQTLPDGTHGEIMQFVHIPRRPYKEPTWTDLKVGLPVYPQSVPPLEHDPLEPLMSYTRVFDGKNSALQASLRDYIELRSEDRAGGWRGTLERSEDFIRFTAHMMIVEMLTLHGGEGKRRMVIKPRKYK